MRYRPTYVTVTIATYPDDHPRFPGLRQEIHRSARLGGWTWRPGAASTPKAAAIDNARDEGAVVTTERYERGPKELRDLLRF